MNYRSDQVGGTNWSEGVSVGIMLALSVGGELMALILVLVAYRQYALLKLSTVNVWDYVGAVV